MKYLYTNKFISDCDCYIFLFCQEFKREIKKIEKDLSINFPKKMFDNFSAKEEEVKLVYFNKNAVILGGFGKNNKCCVKTLMNTMGIIGQLILKEKFKKVQLTVLSNADIFVKTQVESLIIALYKFDKYLKKKVIKPDLYLYSSKRKNKLIINASINIAKVTNEVRDLVNEPANLLNSITFEKQIKKGLAKSKVNIKVINEKELKKKGFNTILAVNQGSKYPAKLVILEYKNEVTKKDKPIVFVGKGVMFDAGGLNIKLNDFTDMKTDMTGAALVYGLFRLMLLNKIKGHFVGLLPLVENMVDAESVRPGDIIKSYSGKTIEIIDTDAEGRLIMADAIAYSKKYKPSLVIDIATLTGQAYSIFNGMSTVIIGNDNKKVKEMEKAGEYVSEKTWELPMWEEYVELTKSDIADVRNYSPDVKSGTIMGGAFLSNFVPSNTKWIHLDIGGVSYLNNSTKYYCSGATGVGLRMLYQFI